MITQSTKSKTCRKAVAFQVAEPGEILFGDSSIRIVDQASVDDSGIETGAPMPTVLGSAAGLFI